MEVTLHILRKPSSGGGSIYQQCKIFQNKFFHWKITFVVCNHTEQVKHCHQNVRTCQLWFTNRTPVVHWQCSATCWVTITSLTTHCPRNNFFANMYQTLLHKFVWMQHRYTFLISSNHLPHTSFSMLYSSQQRARTMDPIHEDQIWGCNSISQRSHPGISVYKSVEAKYDTKLNNKGLLLQQTPLVSN